MSFNIYECAYFIYFLLCWYLELFNYEWIKYSYFQFSFIYWNLLYFPIYDLLFTKFQWLLCLGGVLFECLFHLCHFIQCLLFVWMVYLLVRKGIEVAHYCCLDLICDFIPGIIRCVKLVLPPFSQSACL